MEAETLTQSLSNMNDISASDNQLPITNNQLSIHGETEHVINGYTSNILTLFTTFKHDDLREDIQTNTLVNWKTLTGVNPVLFVSENQNNSNWIRKALDQNWKVKYTSHSYDNVPILKHMFSLVETEGYDTHFLGYANGDILFDQDLVNSLKVIMDASKDSDTPVLVTGRRKNVNVIKINDPSCLSCISSVANTASLFQPNAEDYFIVSRSRFPWASVPDFIVGWPGYDNWLVAMAIRWEMFVVDTSLSVNAVHQVGFDGVKSGWNHRDPNYNLRMTPGFNFAQGKTTCAPWKTFHSPSYRTLSTENNNCILLLERLEIPDECRHDHHTLDAYVYDNEWVYSNDYLDK